MNPRSPFSAGVQEMMKGPFTLMSSLSSAQLAGCLDLAATRAKVVAILKDRQIEGEVDRWLKKTNQNQAFGGQHIRGSSAHPSN